MTVQEFSDQFDVLYNNITSNQAPGLNEYEKSVFLTKAQDEIIKNYFSPKGNLKQDGFDGSPKRQADFSSIIETATLQIGDSTSRFDQRSIVYRMPSNLFISLNEQLMVNNNPFTIVPISYQEYDRLMSKPYKYPPKHMAWRLITRNAVVSSSPSTAEGEYKGHSLITVSEYGKPIRLIVRSTTGSSVPPTIEETTYSVTITMVIGKTIIREIDGQAVPINSTVKYWNYYLSGYNSRPCYTAGYFKPWDGSDGNSAFPAMPIGDDWTNETLYDILNQGGTPAGVATIAEVIGRFTSTPTYRMRYIKKPSPIVLVSLGDIQNGLSIQGVTAARTSELPDEIHEEILQRAVELAKVAWGGDSNQSQLEITAGQRSE